ncbi:MAG: hypothetical protein Q8O76_01460 [Chloroflexota bacterium]|nr:hypothetical protein [Chloroflexota bacterium]
MGEKMKRFLALEDVKAFARDKGYNVDHIQSAKKPQNWTNDKFRVARIGEYLNVFERQGSWPEFDQHYCQQVGKGLMKAYKTWAAKLFNSGEEEAIILPVVYVGTEDSPILFANNFVIQHTQKEFILTVGQIQPPILLGSPEIRREQAKRLSYVPVKVVTRLGFTRQRLVELIQVLQDNLQIYDSKQGGERTNE